MPGSFRFWELSPELAQVLAAAEAAVRVNAVMNPGAAQTRLNELGEALEEWRGAMGQPS